MSPSRTGNKTKNLHKLKILATVGRVYNVFGDRNPTGLCVGMENYSAELSPCLSVFIRD